MGLDAIAFFEKYKNFAATTFSINSKIYRITKNFIMLIYQGSFPQMSASVVINNKLFSRMAPSSLKIYEIIKTSKRLRFDDIASQTKYSTRTVRYALRDLKNAGLIGKIHDINDMRRCYYTALAYNNRIL
jgi:DNA-binding MarR family transcriptional regulator